MTLSLCFICLACSVGVITNLIGVYSYSACDTYRATHTFMCMLFYDNVTGANSLLGLIDGSYEVFVKNLAILSAASSVSSAVYLYEGLTNIMIIIPVTPLNIYVNYTSNGNGSSLVIPSNPYPVAQCYCTTSNCNANLDLCASGLNYSRLLLAGNSTTTLASTTSATSISGISSNSTLRQSNTTMASINNTNGTTILLTSSM